MQVEDLRSQLVGKTDLEQKLVEDNRVLHQMVMRVDTEKKRLSMENEQLNWKMSQSFTAANKDFNVLNTPDGEFFCSFICYLRFRKSACLCLNIE